jgi:hypothetical protein
VRRVIVACALGIIGVGVSPCFAQPLLQPMSQPMGVQGQANLGQSPQGPPPRLSLQGSLFGGYDFDEPTQSKTNFFNSPSQLGGTVGFNVVLSGPRVAFGAGGGSAFRLDHLIGNETLWSHNAGAELSVQLARRVSFRAAGTAAYSPQYQFSLFAPLSPVATGQSVLPTSNYSLSAHDVFAYQSGVSLSYAPTRRSSFDFDYGVGYVDFRTGDQDVKTYDVRGTYRRNVTRNAGFHAGYGYRHGGGTHLLTTTTAGAPVLRAHNLDIGTDFARALSVTRRLSISFGFGSGLIGYGTRNSLRLFGHAILNRNFLRTWHADVAFRRDMRFVTGLVDPLFADSVGISLGGSLGPVLALKSSANYATGQVGFSSGNFSTYQGDVRLERGIAGWAGIFGEYFYYHYLFDMDVLPTGSPRGLDRHGVRAGVNIALPLVR